MTYLSQRQESQSGVWLPFRAESGFRSFGLLWIFVGSFCINKLLPDALVCLVSRDKEVMVALVPAD